MQMNMLRNCWMKKTRNDTWQDCGSAGVAPLRIAVGKLPDTDNWRPVTEVLTYLYPNCLFWIEHTEDHSLRDKTNSRMSTAGPSTYSDPRN